MRLLLLNPQRSIIYTRLIPGLIAYWPLQELQWDIANDFSPGSEAYPGAELLDQSNDGVWDADNDWNPVLATLTNPSEGILRVAHNGVVNNPSASQDILAIGEAALLRGEARSDGNATPQLWNAETEFARGTTSTDWQELLIRIVPASSTSVFYQSLTTTPGQYCEWRNISVRPSNPLSGNIVGATIGQPASNRLGYAVSFDGNNDYIDIYSEALNTALDTGNGAAGTFAKSDTWAAGVDVLFRVAADASNEVVIYRDGTDLICEYQAGGVSKTVTIASGSPTGFFQIWLTWDTTADEMKAYYNGVQSGATQTSLGTWAGALSPTDCVIGAANTTPSNVWAGDVCHVSMYDETLSAETIKRIAASGGVG